jgi:hypothetical protein
LAFLSSLDATARSFRGAAPILHRADQNDPKNETEDQQQRDDRKSGGIPGDDMNLTSACAASRCFDTASTLTAKST